MAVAEQPNRRGEHASSGIEVWGGSAAVGVCGSVVIITRPSCPPSTGGFISGYFSLQCTCNRDRRTLDRPAADYARGESFASRVAMSLLKAIDLPELVTTTIQEYEDLGRVAGH